MKRIIALFIIILSVSSCPAIDRLWYTSPAERWTQALPIGNGRLGGMVFGGTVHDCLAIDESTLWSGQPNPDQDRPFGRQKLNELRQLFFAGKAKEGNDLAWNALVGNQTSFGTHLPIGKMNIDFKGMDDAAIKDYHRQLNLTTAVATTTFIHKGVKHTREAFSSNPDEVLVYRMKADKKGQIAFTLSVTIENEMPVSFAASHKGNEGCLNFSGQALFPMHGPGGVIFEGCVVLLAKGGTVKSSQSVLTVSSADEVLLLFDFRTDYKRPEYRSQLKREIDMALAKPFETLLKRHTDDYAPLYKRVELNLCENDAFADLPTDVRQRNADKGVTDPGFDALYFQMGRYLTIASSRENSPLPIALQGFFNDNKACTMPWTNDYHLDINTQQNYWATGVGNLSECDAPLFKWIASLVEPGSKTAKTVYGCKGWTAHTTVNVWGYTAPSSCIAWGLHPTAGSWIASHLWMHYEFTQDKDFLRNVAYPLLKGNAEFLLDYMTVDPRNGYFVTGPSISPENAFAIDGQHINASMMPTCDLTFAYEILNATLQSTQILGVDKALGDSLSWVISHLPPYKIGKDGGLMEWFEDWDQPNPNHRHTSHLMGFWPYAQITLQHQPELSAAVRKTIELRLAAKDWEDTEWSRSNIIGTYARLMDAKKAYQSVKILEGYLSRENLLTVSPGGIAGAENDIYSFDGNPAGSAGIAEMLLQNQNGALQLLPALPEAWHTGSFKGLCIRGGGIVGASWKEGRLVSATVESRTGHLFAVEVPRYGSFKATVDGRVILPENGLWLVQLRKGQVLNIK